MKDLHTDEGSGAELVRAVREAGRALAQLLKTAIDAAPAGAAPVRLDHPFSNLSRQEWAEIIRCWNAAAKDLLADVPGRPCPACGADDGAALFESYDSHLYVECRRCRCWYAPKRIDGAVFERLFAINPQARRFGDYTTAQATRAEAASADRARFETYYRDLRDLFPGGDPSTLDVGCGVGTSLIVAQELGFRAAGVEVNAAAVEIARGRGLDVDFPSRGDDGRRHDVITFWESLEHLHDPLAALNEAANRLAPNGVIAITAPNLDSPSIRGMRGDSLQIHGGPAWPGHINLFTAKTITRLLARAGFDVIDVAGQYSMSLPEVIGYNIGEWSGARDYLMEDDPAVELPALAALMAAELSPLVAAWEEQFAFGPILRVLAVRSGAPRPPGLASVKERRRSRILSGLEAHFGDIGARPRVRKRGRDIGFAASFADAGAREHKCGVRFTGSPASYAYLWKSVPIALGAGEKLRLRGRLYAGGFTFGLLQNGQWNGSINFDAAGLFELDVAAASAGEFEAVIANNNPAAGATDFDLDHLEIVSAAE